MTTRTTTAEHYTKWPKVDITNMPSSGQSKALTSAKRHSKLLAIYPVFFVATALLTIFFVASLVLAFTTQYFLDWSSALVGLLGSAGLWAVAWFSKREIER